MSKRRHARRERGIWLVELLVLCAEGLESPTRPTLHGRMETLLKEHGHVLDE